MKKGSDPISSNGNNKGKKVAIMSLSLALLVACYAGYDLRCRSEQQIAELHTDAIVRQKEIEEKEKELNALKDKVHALDTEIHRLQQEVARGNARKFSVEVTAYGLGLEECGIAIGEEGYGLTATGKDLAGHTRESAMTIAVDPSVIPLGSRVRVMFDEPDMEKYNGIYTAEDTGGAIRGRRIDLFMGEDSYIEMDAFGRRTATVQIL